MCALLERSLHAMKEVMALYLEALRKKFSAQKAK
jgi:hypothetical protein